MVYIKESKERSNKRIIVGMEAGVVAVTAVAAIVLMSVHFGPKITTEAYKVVHQTFKSDEGDIFEEETNVTKTEVDVRISNMAEVIYDYEHGIVVTRFVDRESNTQSECIAQHMNETEAPSLDPNEYSNGEVDIHQKKDNETDKKEWVRTDIEVPQYLISEKVEGMCKESKIYWMKSNCCKTTFKMLHKVIFMYPIVKSNELNDHIDFLRAVKCDRISKIIRNC
ncbi:uncharacterized protein LOC132721145 [Ruditapes philippinarum]|uniref:uncharacterized protein LOC132721145 n=1 Tax=Ruditapes philippinarum TaxID=129788 RepID=UPI00295B4500|nr:uncharacterized protein LOC132721145 [Ruditapes philippinarum]